MKYRIDGRDEANNSKRVEQKLGLGVYPEFTLKDVRDRRDEARAPLAKGIDPAEQKRRDVRVAKISAANTFTAVAEAYIAKNERARSSAFVCDTFASTASDLEQSDRRRLPCAEH